PGLGAPQESEAGGAGHAVGTREGNHDYLIVAEALLIAAVGDEVRVVVEKPDPQRVVGTDLARLPGRERRDERAQRRERSPPVPDPRCHARAGAHAAACSIRRTTPEAPSSSTRS